MTSTWSFLPPDILVSIFELLSDKDRCRSSCTCKAWNEVSKTPCLWRKRTFIFRGYCRSHTERVQKIRECVQSVGCHIRNMRLICPSPNLLTAFNVAQCVRTLFSEMLALNRGKTTVQSFVVKDLDFDETWRGFRTSRDHLVFSLNRFLVKQRKLKFLDISNASMPPPFAFSIIEGIMKSPSLQTLENFRLENFFSPMVADINVVSSLYFLFGTFLKLKRISLNICYLDDRSFLRLFSNVKNSLKQLDLFISCKNNGSELDPITPDAWKEALYLCHDLKVSLNFDYWPTELTYYIQPELPLVEFSIRGFLGGNCRMSYESRISHLMNYLLRHFSTKLTKLSLLTFTKVGRKPTSPPLRFEEIIRFWSKCPKLQTANFSCALILPSDKHLRVSKTLVVKASAGMDRSKSRRVKVTELSDSDGFAYYWFRVTD